MCAFLLLDIGDRILQVQVDERKGYLDTSYMIDKKGI